MGCNQGRNIGGFVNICLIVPAWVITADPVAGIKQFALANNGCKL